MKHLFWRDNGEHHPMCPCRPGGGIGEENAYMLGESNLLYYWTWGEWTLRMVRNEVGNSR